MCFGFVTPLYLKLFQRIRGTVHALHDPEAFGVVVLHVYNVVSGDDFLHTGHRMTHISERKRISYGLFTLSEPETAQRTSENCVSMLTWATTFTHFSSSKRPKHYTNILSTPNINSIEYKSAVFNQTHLYHINTCTEYWHFQKVQFSL